MANTNLSQCGCKRHRRNDLRPSRLPSHSLRSTRYVMHMESITGFIFFMTDGAIKFIYFKLRTK